MTVSAASGPYAAELRASRPKMPMPETGPTRSARSSVVESGRPSRKSRIATLLFHHQSFGPFAQIPVAEGHVGSHDREAVRAGLWGDGDSDGALLARAYAEFEGSGG